MSASGDREGRAFFRVGVLIFGLAAAAQPPASADGYVIEDGGLRQPAAYDEGYGGESVLVAPGGSGSFETLGDPAPAEADESVVPEGLGGGWLAAGCTECGGQGCTSCEGAACGHGLCGPVCHRWAVQVDALMLWQGNIASRPLFANAAGFTALDANQAYPPLSAGPRVGLFYFLNQTYAIEGNYFNVRPFNGTAVTLPGQILTEQSLAGFGRGSMTGGQLLTNGAIQSAELNWRRRECWCPVTWLAGFRWVEWNQQMGITDHFAGGASRFFSETGNDLYGGQAGLDLGLWNSGGPFTVNGVGKAGVFYNTAYQRTTYTDPIASAAAAADQTAFFGEVGINGSLRLTDWLSWRVGYVLFWLSGVAVPADQLSTTNLAAAPPTATINTNGSVFLHGATTGLEARW
jgi:hypothetical protein